MLKSLHHQRLHNVMDVGQSVTDQRVTVRTSWQAVAEAQDAVAGAPTAPRRRGRVARAPRTCCMLPRSPWQFKVAGSIQPSTRLQCRHVY